MNLSERAHAPISTRELERRWAVVREAMEERGVDVLLMQNTNDYVGGYVKYFTDVPAVAGYAATVVFPQSGPMTVISHGALGGERELPPEGDGVLRGVGRVLTTSAFASAAYTGAYDAAVAVDALAPYARATIGLVGTAQMPHAFARHVTQQLDRARFVEASDLVDPIKAVKSDEEVELIRLAAALQDAALAAAFAEVEPGKKDSEITAAAHRACLDLGSEQSLFMCTSSPVGRPAGLGYRHMQDRVIREGDAVLLMIEANGPGGFYTQIGRTCVVGDAPQRMQEEFELALEAQRFCLGLMKPGTPAAEVWGAYNAFLRDHGRPEEQRLHCHGQGYDLVERPLVRFDETMTIEAGMNIACHPGWLADDALAWVCDGFLIGPAGSDRLHAYPQSIASA